MFFVVFSSQILFHMISLCLERQLVKHWSNCLFPCLLTFANPPAAVACSRMLSSVTRSLCLLQSASQFSCGGGTGQPIIAGFRLPKGALKTTGQHLTRLETTLTVLLGETQEPLKSSSQTSPAVTPVSQPPQLLPLPWWWEGLYPQGQTLEIEAHTSSERAKGRAQSLRRNPVLSSPSRKTKSLCRIIGC